MARSRAGKSNHQPDGRGGTYTLLPHAVLDALLRSVGPRAVAVALAICRRFNGFNNGRIAMSTRDLAEVICSANHKANIAALRELESAGFIVASRFPKGQRKATEYRLTFVSYGANGEYPATNDYLAKLETYLETKKITASETEAREPQPDSDMEARRKHRVVDMEAGETGTCGFPESPPASISEAHIYNHPKPFSGSDRNTCLDTFQINGGVSECTAGMDENELRRFAVGYLSNAAPGTQSRLAHEAGIPGGTLSKFLAGRARLPVCYHMPLQLAVGRAFPMAARNAV